MELTKNDSAPRWLSKCQAGEDIVPDALSRIFGEIASRIEESEGIQIGNDHGRMVEVSANALVQGPKVAAFRSVSIMKEWLK